MIAPLCIMLLTAVGLGFAEAGSAIDASPLLLTPSCYSEFKPGRSCDSITIVDLVLETSLTSFNLAAKTFSARVYIYAEWDDQRVGDSSCSVLETTPGCGPNIWDPAIYFPDAIDVRIMSKMLGPAYSWGAAHRVVLKMSVELQYELSGHSKVDFTYFPWTEMDLVVTISTGYTDQYSFPTKRELNASHTIGAGRRQSNGQTHASDNHLDSVPKRQKATVRLVPLQATDTTVPLALTVSDDRAGYSTRSCCNTTKPVAYHTFGLDIDQISLICSNSTLGAHSSDAGSLKFAWKAVVNWGYYSTHIFFPQLVYLTIAYATFYLAIEFIQARIATCVLVVLSMHATQASLMETLPRLTSITLAQMLIYWQLATVALIIVCHIWCHHMFHHRQCQKSVHFTEIQVRVWVPVLLIVGNPLCYLLCLAMKHSPSNYTSAIETLGVLTMIILTLLAGMLINRVEALQKLALWVHRSTAVRLGATRNSQVVAIGLEALQEPLLEPSESEEDTNHQITAARRAQDDVRSKQDGSAYSHNANIALTSHT